MSFQPQPNHVQLGEHIYDVKPQSIGYLRAMLGHLFNDLTASEVAQANLVGILVEKAYDMLVVFIPDEDAQKLMPRWEFEGYATEEAWIAGDYDRRYDKSPSIPQVRTALQVAAKANGLDLWNVVKSLVDPTLLRAALSKWIANAISEESSTVSLTPTDGASSQTSETSAPPSEESPSTD